MAGKGCALHHWVHDVVFNVGNQLVILIADVLTQFLPKCMEGFFLYTLYLYNSFSFLNPFIAYRRLSSTTPIIGYIPVLAPSQSALFPLEVVVVEVLMLYQLSLSVTARGKKQLIMRDLKIGSLALCLSETFRLQAFQSDSQKHLRLRFQGLNFSSKSWSRKFETPLGKACEDICQ
ncbi:hypothetical protein Tco_0272862 [Tanacetum coccineum]